MFVDKKKIKKEDDPDYVTDEEISDETSSMTSSSGETSDEEQGEGMYFIHCSQTLKSGYMEVGSLYSDIEVGVHWSQKWKTLIMDML